MVLVPVIFDSEKQLMRPCCMLDRHGGVGLEVEDYLLPFSASLMKSLPEYYRPPSSVSTVIKDKDKFQVNLDVHQFSPDELTVKVNVNNTIIVEGKHDEKQDVHGVVSQQFLRKYDLPHGHDINRVICNLSSDGVLSIIAPRTDQVTTKDRSIPIHQTGVPSKPLASKAENKEDDTKKD